MKGSLLAVLALGVLTLPGPAGATILYSNLANADSNAALFGVSSTRWGAASFTTDNNTYTLSDVQVLLEGISGGQGVTVNLYNSTAGAPNASVATLGTINEASLSTNSFTVQTVAGGNITLAANSLYYIVLSGLSSGQFDANWESAVAGPGTGITGSVTQIMAISGNSGGAWATHLTSSDFKPFTLQVDVASSAPEPGTMLGAAAGLVLVVAGRLRRKKRS